MYNSPTEGHLFPLMKRLRIFVASPSDVPDERDVVSVVVDELRRIVGDLRQVELEAVRWETHAWPDAGDDAQAVINREIGQYDIFIGVMWRRFGTPTGRAESGTGEEFERAYQAFREFGRPKIMFYFRVTPFYTSDLTDLDQFTKVVAFRKKLEEAGVLFWQYQSPLEFERFVREHLIRQIFDVTNRSKSRRVPKAGAKKRAAVRSVRVFLSAARDDVERVLPVYSALAEAGFAPWLDVQNLLPGQMWTAAIERAIRESDAFVVFLSQNSVSKRGFVQKEVQLALKRLHDLPPGKVFVIPVRLEPVDAPEPLRNLQWIDLFPNPVAGIEHLISALRGASTRIQRSRKRQ